MSVDKTAEQLRACPFCGGVNIEHAGRFSQQMHCPECGAFGPMVFTDAAAPIAWNTRQDDPNFPNELDELQLTLIEVTEERDHLRSVIAKTRADSGEAVAWLQVEPGVSLEQAVSQNGILAHSMHVHVGRQKPNKSQDANGLFPLFTHARATAVDAFAIAKAFTAGFKEACEWSAPVVQDIDSAAFGSSQRLYVEAAIASREGDGS